MEYTLAEELPFAVVVKDKHLGMVCSSCFASKTDGPISPCIGCKVLYYCNNQCQLNDFVNHEHECEMLKSAYWVPDWTCRLVARIALKLKCGDETTQPTLNERVYADPMDHSDHIQMILIEWGMCHG